VIYGLDAVEIVALSRSSEAIPARISPREAEKAGISRISKRAASRSMSPTP